MAPENIAGTAFQANKMDLRTYTLLLGEDGIFYCQVKKYADCNMKDAKELINAMKVLGKGKEYPMLTTIEDFVTTTNDAKKFMSKKENNKYMSASAVITKHIGYKIGTNLFIKFYKPEIPTKFFLKEQEAIKWLKKFL